MIVLSLPDIKGDVTVDGYLQWIAIEAMSCEYLREAAPDPKTGVGFTMGVAPLSPVYLEKSLDTASIHLMEQSIAGAALKGTGLVRFLSASSTGGTANTYLEFKLDAPVVSEWSLDGVSDDRPTESMSLLYNKIAIAYFTNPDGKGYKPAGVKGWDFVNNVAWTG